jgi:hypothetical protein
MSGPQPHNPAGLNPEIRRGEISILLPTRGRPETLAQVFLSLRDTTVRKDKTVLWLYVDDDDLVMRQAIENKTLPDPGFAINWHIAPRRGGLGECHQELWKASGRASEVYVIFVDDAVLDAHGWDEIVRSKHAEYPDGVLLTFPHDPLTADQATYPFLGWGWLQAVGYVYPGYFPYWGDDKWVDEVGRMSGRRAKLPLTLHPIGGKGMTKRMRNVPFWTSFFQLTLYERKDAARRLIAAIYPDEGEQRKTALAAMEQAAAGLAKEQERFSDIYCVFQEERHTEMTLSERQLFNQKYFQQECFAIARLISRAQELMTQKEYAQAIPFLDAVQFSDLKVRQAGLMMAECLRAVGRHHEANQMDKDSQVCWPRMNTLRRLFRFLGMVANDGKRMLIGFFDKSWKKSPGK